MNTGIYSITNAANGKQYVGSAVNFSARWHQHKRGLRNANHRSRVLQSTWDKHGESAFVFEKLLVCSRDNLLMYEQICIDALRPQYNMFKTAGSSLGYKHTPEALAKISATHAGRKRPPGTGEKISAAKLGKKWSHVMRAKRTGVRQSEGHVEKRIAPLRGRKANPEAIAKRWETLRQKGWERSAETIAKHAAAIRGSKASAETRAKQSAARLGKKRSPEFGAKMSAINKGRVFSEESRVKMSESAKLRRKRELDAREARYAS